MVNVRCIFRLLRRIELLTSCTIYLFIFSHQRHACYRYGLLRILCTVHGEIADGNSSSLAIFSVSLASLVILYIV